MSNGLCLKCESEKASLECSECGKLFNVTTALLCEECSTAIHQPLSAVHGIKSITCNEVSEETAKLENDVCSQWFDSESSRVHKMISEIQANQQLLKDQITMGIDNFKQLLDTRHSELLSNVDLVCERKVKLLTRHLEQLQIMVDRGEPKPPRFPTLPGNTSGGFVPPMATLHHATACLMTDSSGEVAEGDRVSVTAIGSIDHGGCFSVRLLPDRDGMQDITLQNISNSLEIDHALTPPSSSSSRTMSLSPGQLCSARYSVDQRWYRAKVIDASVGRGKAKVYFLDHGNTEDMSTSSIAPLDDKYQVFPFQMIQCCFSVDPKYSYSDREVRWKFNDLTHCRCLTATIIRQLPDCQRGKLYLVELFDDSGSQGQDIGASVLAMAEGRSNSHHKDSIKYRDVRYKDQPLPPNSKQVVTSATPPSVAADGTTHGVKPVSVQPPISTQPISTQSLSTSTEVNRSQQSSPSPHDTHTQTESSSNPSTTLPDKSSSLLGPPSTSLLGPPPPSLLASQIGPPLSEVPASLSEAPSQTEPRHAPVTVDDSETEPHPLPEADDSQGEPHPIPQSGESLTEPHPLPGADDSQREPHPIPGADDSQREPHPILGADDSQAKPHPIPGADDSQAEPHPNPGADDSQAKPHPIPGTNDSQAKPHPIPGTNDSQARPHPIPGTNDSQAKPHPIPGTDDSQAKPHPIPRTDDLQVEPRPTPPTDDSSVTTSKPQVVADGVCCTEESMPFSSGVGVVEAESAPGGQDKLVNGETSESKPSTVKKEREKCNTELSSSDEELLRLMHPSIMAGAELEAYVTTSLTADGSFWAQLASDDPSYDQLAEELREKLSETRDVMTPVFFNVGDICAALFSEDESWYRARITGASGGLFTVRYLDFGNSEKREARYLFPLRSEFRQLPFQAIHCSIVSDEHPTFTQPEVDKFNKIVPTEEPVTINVVRLEGTTVYVELFLKLPGGESVDLTEEVYSADVTHFKSMDFGASMRTKKLTVVPSTTPIDAKPARTSADIASEAGSTDTVLSSSCPLPSPLPLSVSDSLTHQSNWADEMDAIQSPKDDGFLTLPGHESQGPSDRSKSPSPCPSPFTMETQTIKPQSQQIESNLVDPPSRGGVRKERENSRSVSPRPVRAVRVGHDDRESKPSTSPSRTSSGSSVAGSRSAPRLNMGMATKQILSGIGHRGPRTGRETRRREREGGAYGGEKTAGSKHQGERSPSPYRASSSASSHSSDKPSTTSVRPTSDVVQLFVKNIPITMSPTDVSRLFATFGKVHNYVQDKTRKQVVYIHMSPESAQKAITGLHGKAIAKNSHPLFVQESNEKRF